MVRHWYMWIVTDVRLVCLAIYVVFKEVRDSVQEEGRVPLHKVDRQLRIKVTGCHRLLLSRLN